MVLYCDYFTNKKALPLPSLPKNQIPEFIEGLLPDTWLLIEPKIDGCAIALQYRNGNLEKVISRKGTDDTSKIAKIEDIPNQLPIQGIFQVRGELYAPNKATNVSQRIVCRFLWAREGSGEGISFCSFQILNSRLNQHEAKKHPKKLGFSTPKDAYCNFTSQVQIFRKKWLDKKPELGFKEVPSLDNVIVEFLRKYEVFVVPPNKKDLMDVAITGAVTGMAGADVGGIIYFIR